MAATLKEKIISAIGQSDDNKLLSIIYSVIEAYEDKQIIGYDTKGNPLTVEQLQDQLSQASDRMDNGSFVTTEEMRKRAASWQ